MDEVIVDLARGDGDLQQVLELQGENLERGLSGDEARSQGFVTLRHDLDLLRRMADALPQVVARCSGRVVGYALAMLPEDGRRIPLLEPMFAELAGCEVAGTRVLERRWFVMGQVCVARAFRGRGVFDRLYGHMRSVFSPGYELVVTELATRNVRSARAHARAGFELLRRYRDPSGEQWDLVAWDWGEGEDAVGSRPEGRAESCPAVPGGARGEDRARGSSTDRPMLGCVEDQVERRNSSECSRK